MEDTKILKEAVEKTGNEKYIYSVMKNYTEYNKLKTEKNKKLADLNDDIKNDAPHPDKVSSCKNAKSYDSKINAAEKRVSWEKIKLTTALNNYNLCKNNYYRKTNCNTQLNNYNRQVDIYNNALNQLNNYKRTANSYIKKCKQATDNYNDGVRDYKTKRSSIISNYDRKINSALRAYESDAAFLKKIVKNHTYSNNTITNNSVNNSIKKKETVIRNTQNDIENSQEQQEKKKINNTSENYYKIYVENKCKHEITIAIDYKESDYWVSKAWYKIAPNKEAYIGNTKYGVYYYYAYFKNATYKGEYNREVDGKTYPFRKKDVSNESYGKKSIILACDGF